MALDDLQSMNARQAASDMVLVATLNAIHQMAPHAGLSAALHQVIENSIPHFNVIGATPAQAAEFREHIRSHAKSIIDSGLK